MRRSRPPAVRRFLAGLAGAALIGGTFAASTSASADIVGPGNGSFEESLGAEEIPGWTPNSSAPDDAFTVVDTDAVDGEHSLRVRDSDPAAGVRLDSDPFPVDGGERYRVEADFRLDVFESPTAPIMYVYFFDGAGTQVDFGSTGVGTVGEDPWQTVTMTVDAPDEAVTATVMLYSSIANVTDYLVDDVTVQPSAPPGQVTDLGSLLEPNVRLAATGTWSDGRPVAYAFSDGSPVSFNAVDLRTGDLLDTVEFPGYTVASTIDIADDGTVYLSVRAPNDGTLWRYTPGSGVAEKIASDVVGEAMLRTLLIDGDMLYGTTYPEAKVYSYNMVTGEFHDYGRVVDDGAYAWGFEKVGDELWIGTGAVPHLIALNPQTGERREIELPAEATGASFINRLERHGDLVFVNYSPGGAGGTVVYDTTTGTWCCNSSIERPIAFGQMSKAEHDGRFFYGSGDTVYAYDMAGRQTESIGWADAGLAGALDTSRNVEPVELGTAEFPGVTLVGVRGNGTIWRYNLETGTASILPSRIGGAPATIHSMGTAPDGNVYIGTYLSAGVMGRVDRATGTLEQLTGPKQADSIVAHDGKLVVGEYPNALYHSGDVSQEWNWGINPSHLFTLGRAESGQDRPLSLASAGDVVASGTIPNYGELGGALVLFDADTGEHEFHRHVVPDQSVTTVAYADGLVYGGTSIHGGLSSTPTQTEAELFVWDVQAGERVWSGPAVPGATIYHALAWAPDGMLWMITDDGTIAEFDPSTRQVTRSIDSGARNNSSWGRLSELTYRDVDGRFYGNTGGRLFSFDPETLEYEVIVDAGVKVSAIDADGTVYYGDTTNVYRYEPTCDRTVTGEHDGPLTVNTGTTCVVDADVEGPISVTAPGALTVTDSDIVGPVRADGARHLRITGSSVDGPVSITATQGDVVLAGSTINGPLSCTGNAQQPTDGGDPTTVTGPATGQCADL